MDGVTGAKVRGDSMKPVYLDGDTVLIDIKSEKNFKKLLGKEAVLFLDDGSSVIKIVEQELDDGRFLLCSHNMGESPRIAKILRAYKVRGIIRS